MFVRVVRFTDVSAERMQALNERIDAADGPPEGVPSTGITIAVDADQGTAVVMQYFETAEDMATGAAILAAMDPGETPGTRASVDSCEVKVELKN